MSSEFSSRCAKPRLQPDPNIVRHQTILERQRLRIAQIAGLTPVWGFFDRRNASGKMKVTRK